MKNIMDNELLSFTTRPMREGEKDGLAYKFINNIDFDSLLYHDKLAEYTEYPPQSGNFYGLTMEELMTKLETGHAFFICDNNGFNQIKEKYKNVVSIFLYAEEDDCINNMVGRGDTLGNIESRLATYENEMANSGQYDYVVKNIRGFAKLTENILEEIIYAEICKFANEVTK
jgi:guanylate kinase